MEFGNIGVFLCSCGKTLDLDFKKIAKSLEKIEEVSVVERVERLCTEDGLAYIVDDLRRKELDKMVIGACSNKNRIFEEVADQQGLDPMSLDIVNIREECAWVHENKKGATQKAVVLLKNAVERAPDFPEIVDVQADPSLLIAGDIRALDLAEDLSDFGAHIYIVNKDPYLRREGLSRSGYIPENKGSVYEFSEATIHNNSEIVGIDGDLGDFTVEISKKSFIDTGLCVDCGKCIDVCPEKAVSSIRDSTQTAYEISDKCTLCGECVNVCPTDAVVLEPENEFIGVGQIISFYPVDAQEGVFYVGEDGKGARAAALQASLNIKGYQKEKYIGSEIEKCANLHIKDKKVDFEGCTYCEGSCAYYPVASGYVSDIACKGCGACQTACPQSAYTLSTQSFEELLTEVDNTGEAEIKPRIVMFTCSEGGFSTLRAAGLKKLKYPPAVPLVVPCLGNVSELHILRAFDQGAEGVILLGCGSDGCMYEKGFERGARSVAMAKEVLGFFGIGKDRIRMLKGDGTDPEKFVTQIKEFEERIGLLGKSTLARGKPADLDLEKKEGLKRDVLYGMLSVFSQKTGIKEGMIKGDLPIGRIRVDEKECTLCGSCSYHCNAGAFRHEGDEILDIFNTHTYCIGCGICEEICPEDAIVLERFLDLESFLDKKEKKFEVKIISCSRCGKPLMAEAAFNKLKKRLNNKELDMLQKCQSCLDKGAVADILNVDPDADDFVVIQQGKAPWES